MIVTFFYDITDPSTCISRSPYTNSCTQIPSESVLWTCLLRDGNENVIGEGTWSYSSTSFERDNKLIQSTQGIITYLIYELETSFNEIYRDVEIIDNDVERKRRIVSTDGKLWNVKGYVTTQRLPLNPNKRRVEIKFCKK